MNATTLTHVLKHHGIHPRFWLDFRLLVNHQREPSGELQTRLRYVDNYKEALAESLTLETSNESCS